MKWVYSRFYFKKFPICVEFFSLPDADINVTNYTNKNISLAYIFRFCGNPNKQAYQRNNQRRCDIIHQLIVFCAYIQQY